MVNEGMKDRVIRMFLGVIISSIFIGMNSKLAFLGVPVFVTGIVGFCPLYKLLGINTIPREAQH